jgi:protein-disulfide isomerase
MEPTVPNPTPAPAPASKNNLLIPISIVVAGLLIAGALFAAQIINHSHSDTAVTKVVNQHLEKNMNPITTADHIRGSIDAPIKIVEYSDTDCPFCQLFHPVLQNIMTQYATSSKIAWIYRYFNTHIPAHIHTQSEAEAAECVASIGGNDAYWNFIDVLFSKKDFTKNPATLVATSSLPVFAASFGVNKTQFNSCYNAHTFKANVDKDTMNATASGGDGTPFTIVTTKAPVSNDLQKIMNDVNNNYHSQYPTAPDILFSSEDKHMIVLSGAMPAELMNQIFQMLVASNS